MAGNTFGQLLRLTTFGESHGKAIGGIIDGFPAGIEIDMEAILYDLKRRRPGQSSLVSQRKEDDDIEVLSGVFEGVSLGTPIAFVIWNKDQQSADYSHLKNVFRPSHADFTFQEKYGVRDYRGGGRASARETVARVAAGGFAKLLLKKAGIDIISFVQRIGPVSIEQHYTGLDFSLIEKSPVRCPELSTSEAMVSLLGQTAKTGDTLGGEIMTVVTGMPIGLGEPVFDKLHADLGKAMLSINAVKGFEYGSGFDAAKMTGSAHNDIFVEKDGKIETKTNYSGGIQGGISNGERYLFQYCF
jgi:chorismate synthase